MKLPLRPLRLTIRSIVSGWAIAGVTLFSQQAYAQQIRADNTLTIPTNVSTVDNQNFAINDGTQLGNNLFHSFETFSVPTQGSAVFNSPANIANIISRVTGSQVSNIDGLIKTNGTDTNLFFLNRNGIVFGPDAELQVGGSFVASTAESLKFTNGAEFVSRGASLDPLLTISTPTGLQLGSTSGRIEVNDIGYTLISGIPLKIDSSPSLRVNPGRTLALIGSQIDFEGGIVAAPGGQVEIGSVRKGTVAFDDSWRFDYKDVEQFGNMEFSARSLIDASSLLFNSTGTPYAFGAQGGSIQLQGNYLRFQEESRALIQNYGMQASGDIQAIARDTLEVVGEFSTGERGSGLATMSFRSGAGGHINVVAPRVLLIGDTSIGTDTFSAAAGGNVTIKAKDTIRFERNQETPPDYSQIDTISYAAGTAGNLNISTGNLVILGDGISSQALGTGAGGLVEVAAKNIIIEGGGNIASSTLVSGRGGNVKITADNIQISGVNPVSLLPSIIAAPSTGTGDAGDVIINTRQLSLKNGGRIDSSTLSAGNAGSVTVTAAESVTVEGTVAGSVNPSLIISSANIVDPALRSFFETIGVFLPALPSGASGNVTINTPNLTVSDGAQVTVRNDGTGDAGTLTANVGSVYVSDRAGITASTQQGSGGNIVLNVRDVVLLRRESRLSAEAGGVGDGGNITLNAPVVIALENSDITASAIEGAGGTIKINARAILGTEFRDQLTPESDITASSEFGISGTVDIDQIESDPSSGTVELPENVADPSAQVVAGCADTSAGQFVATGRGGLPPRPDGSLQSNRLWSDIRALDFSTARQSEDKIKASTPPEASPREAITWIVNEQGQIALIDSESSHSLNNLSNLTCLKS